MPGVNRTLQAERDLLEIWVHVAEQTTMDVADALLRRIGSQCEDLATMPGMGRAREDLALGLRSFAVAAYVLYYRPIDDGIRLLRILHGARNIEPLFPGPIDDSI
jgi:toxin ParE1/3/4